MVRERMKMLFAYDGSSYADAALDDLRRAGLPRDAEALVVTVGDVLMTPPSWYETYTLAPASQKAKSVLALAREKASLALEEARVLATESSRRLQSVLPRLEGARRGLGWHALS